MTRISIFGAGGCGQSFAEHLCPGIGIESFIDNDRSREGSEFLGRPVVSPDSMDVDAVDAIVICSTYHKDIYRQLVEECGVAESKILNLGKLYFDVSLRYLFEQFGESQNDVECVVTGLSYSMFGIVPDRMSMKTFNFALGGQDLYYDYRILQKILRDYDAGSLKYALVGLTRYSLHYDASKRRDCDVVSRYIHVMDDSHHAQSTLEQIDRIRALSTSGLDDAIYEPSKLAYVKTFNDIHQLNFSQFKEQHDARDKSIAIARREHEKYYPETVSENTEVLLKMIRMLRQRDIEPIFFSVPCHSSYVSAIPERIESEYERTIERIAGAEGVEVFDMIRSERFNDDHFYDDSHLNEAGAALFTSMMDDYLLQRQNG